jgi:hypothetical protein
MHPAVRQYIKTRTKKPADMYFPVWNKSSLNGLHMLPQGGLYPAIKFYSAGSLFHFSFAKFL